MTHLIIGIMGFKGSGKDTVGKHLVRAHDFKSTSFAKPLKQSLAALMDWSEKDLEGVTAHSRDWRETPDSWWSDQLGTQVTPRHLMQQFGTEIIRKHIHDDFWVMRTRKLIEQTPQNWVITDVRFPNEINMIKSLGGHVIRVQRGADPEWCARAAWINSWPSWVQKVMVWLDPEIKQIHASERAWLGSASDYLIQNNSSKSDLYVQVDQIIQELQKT